MCRDRRAGGNLEMPLPAWGRVDSGTVFLRGILTYSPIRMLTGSSGYLEIMPASVGVSMYICERKRERRGRECKRVSRREVFVLSDFFCILFVFCQVKGLLYRCQEETGND